MSWTQGNHADAPQGSSVIGTADGSVWWLAPGAREAATAEPAAAPEHPHGGPPGQTGENPGHGGTPPGQDKPSPEPHASRSHK